MVGASFQALIEAQASPGGSTGNPGLTSAGPTSAGVAPPAWAGFRPFRLRERHAESRSVAALELEPADGQRLPSFAAGQFIVLRLAVPGSDEPLPFAAIRWRPLRQPHRYRIGAKREAHGVAGEILHGRVGVGDLVEVAAPRGAFTRRPGTGGSVALLSAGVGVTPVLAMLDSSGE